MTDPNATVVNSELNSFSSKDVPVQRQKKPQSSVTSFVAGGGAGMLSTTVLQPLDVIKTHMQAAKVPQNRKFGIVFRGILAEDGVKGLWRGTGPACLRVGLGAGLYFAVLGPMLETIRTAYVGGNSDIRGEGGSLRDNLPAVVTLSTGALTRAIASSVVCPITVIKTRMEVLGVVALFSTMHTGLMHQYAAASGLHYRNTFHAIQTITVKEGLPGLYSGLLPTLARDAPYSGLYLLMYNRMQLALKDYFPTGSPQASINFLAAAVAGGGATLVTHPPDVIRTRLQLEQGHQSSILSTVRHIVEVHGLKGLLVGVLPRVGRRTLQQAFAWTIYEEFVQRISQII